MKIETDTKAIEKAKQIAQQTNLGKQSGLTYNEMLEAAQILILNALSSGGERTDSELFSLSGMNLNYACGVLCNARDILVKRGIVSKEHRMVDHVSMHFYALQGAPLLPK